MYIISRTLNHNSDITLVIQPFQRGNRLYTSESDVCRRQILTYKDDPRAERIEMIMYNGRKPITYVFKWSRKS